MKKSELNDSDAGLWSRLVRASEIYYATCTPETRVTLSPGDARLIVALDREIDIHSLRKIVKARNKAKKPAQAATTKGIVINNLQDKPSAQQATYCDGCDGTGLLEGWNRRDGNPCPKCKGDGFVRSVVLAVARGEKEA